MSICVKIKGKKSALCIGDLDRKVTIRSRNIQAPQSGSVDFSEQFANTHIVWALIQTTRGSEIFNGVELQNPVTHLIYIRFITGLTQESWVEFNSNKYDVVDLQDIDERNEWMLLRCIKKGDESLKANFA